MRRAKVLIAGIVVVVLVGLYLMWGGPETDRDQSGDLHLSTSNDQSEESKEPSKTADTDDARAEATAPRSQSSEVQDTRTEPPQETTKDNRTRIRLLCADGVTPIIHAPIRIDGPDGFTQELHTGGEGKTEALDLQSGAKYEVFKGQDYAYWMRAQEQQHPQMAELTLPSPAPQTADVITRIQHTATANINYYAWLARKPLPTSVLIPSMSDFEIKELLAKKREVSWIIPPREGHTLKHLPPEYFFNVTDLLGNGVGIGALTFTGRDKRGLSRTAIAQVNDGSMVFVEGADAELIEAYVGEVQLTFRPQDSEEILVGAADLVEPKIRKSSRYTTVTYKGRTRGVEFRTLVVAPLGATKTGLSIPSSIRDKKWEMLTLWYSRVPKVEGTPRSLNSWVMRNKSFSIDENSLSLEAGTYDVAIESNTHFGEYQRVVVGRSGLVELKDNLEQAVALRIQAQSDLRLFSLVSSRRAPRTGDDKSGEAAPPPNPDDPPYFRHWRLKDQKVQAADEYILHRAMKPGRSYVLTYSLLVGDKRESRTARFDVPENATEVELVLP